MKTDNQNDLLVDASILVNIVFKNSSNLKSIGTIFFSGDGIHAISLILKGLVFVQKYFLKIRLTFYEINMYSHGHSLTYG